MGFSLPCCFSFFLLLLLLFPTDGQTYKNIYLGSSLNADNNSSSWSSPSGHFAFGFQQAGDAGFLLAIWFNKIPERTIVWSADRNNPAQRGSRECSSTDGQLVLDDKQPRMTAMKNWEVVLLELFTTGLANEDHTPLSPVKKLGKIAREGEQEFKTEVRVIGRTNHKNSVQLIGFYSRPNWCQIMQIAFGVARGLLYLHEECSSQIIRCDTKPQNFILEETLKARISDFGLAKLLKTDHTKQLQQSEEPKEGKLHLLVEQDEEAMEDMKRVERFVMVVIWCIQEDPSFRPGMK
uniref:Protein kinase domain-containing protein n=1 Tax=Populus trichocarpa TaxID=3694 RepID=U5GSL1_POPTR